MRKTIISENGTLIAFGLDRVNGFFISAENDEGLHNISQFYPITFNVYSKKAVLDIVPEDIKGEFLNSPLSTYFNNHVPYKISIDDYIVDTICTVGEWLELFDKQEIKDRIKDNSKITLFNTAYRSIEYTLIAG